MRSIYALLVTVLLCGLFPVQGHAQETPIHVILNGKEVVFPAPPRIENGTTLVPFRALFEAVEMEVLWDNNTQTITAQGNQKKLHLRIGDDKATNNGQTVELETPPQLIDDVAYVPLRFVGEALDYLVDYQRGNDSIRISLRVSALRFPLSGDPVSLDPAVSTNVNSMQPLIGLFEGLVRTDEKGNILPATASSWDISEDMKTYRFNIRPDAVWSNGDAVTAQDFAASWKRVVDLNASLGVDFLSHIDQVNAYRQGKVGWEDTGIRAESDKVLEIRLENPIPYFLQLLADITLVPVHSTARNLSLWNDDPLHFVSNGPFILESWDLGNYIVLQKNPAYHSSSEIFFQQVHFIITDYMDHNPTSLYVKGELDWTGAPFTDLNIPDLGLLYQDETNEMYVKSKANTYYYLFNLTQKPFNNVKVRKALTMAIDNETIVQEYFQIKVRPAHGIVPPLIKGEKSDYRDEYPDPSIEFNVTEAKKLLKEGLQEEGLSTFPAVTITVNEGMHYLIAEKIAKMWKKNLGIQLKLHVVDAETWRASLKTSDYQVARTGYYADYNDPTTFLDMWSSWSSKNYSGFDDDFYDQLLQKANSVTDTHERMRILAEAEAYLIEDQAVIMPLYYTPNLWAQKKEIQNISMGYNGLIDYTRSYYKP
ncbi:ABC transporter substrate-binding protein [Paenibacillus mesotrionivorans]|uniref:ABC transporter substrate-binding protein n=1 Tax=Paenibacillus mesotrionivorans TaxID=3160968 RepID=A0ACC7NXG8_9BACL